MAEPIFPRPINPTFIMSPPGHRVFLTLLLVESYTQSGSSGRIPIRFDDMARGCSGTNLQHNTSQNVPSLDACVRLGCLCQGILCCNGDAEPSLGHSSFQTHELARTDLGVVGDHANLAGTMGFRLDAIGIRQTPT